MTRVYYNSRERLVEDVKTIGQTIIDKADEIVGDWSQVREYEIIGRVAVDEIPSVTFKKTAIALKVNINTKAEVSDYGED